jgi:excinuclease ABC subunit A
MQSPFFMSQKIVIRGARANNLKGIDVEIPRNKLVVVTGVSGSGKSSLAFDTVYAEGQRRYLESLSSYARQFLEVKEKPDVDYIEGLSPTIAIDQKSVSKNPRSTVGTITEIYDLLRLLFARIGKPHCPICGKEVGRQTVEEINEIIWQWIGTNGGRKILNVTILAPVLIKQAGLSRKVLDALYKANYFHVRINGKIFDLIEARETKFDPDEIYSVEVVVDRVLLDGKMETKRQLQEAVKIAADLGDGTIITTRADKGGDFSFNQYYHCPVCNVELPEIEPRSFSFNSPYGACPVCSGMGMKQEIDEDLVFANKKLTIAQGGIKPWVKIFANQKVYWRVLELVAKKYKFSLDVPIEELPKAARKVILYGTGNELFQVDGRPMAYQGVVAWLEQKYKETDSDFIRQEIEKYMRFKTCPSCNGRRLKRESLAVTVADLSIADYAEMPVEDLLKALDGIMKKKLDNRDTQIARQLIVEVKTRLKFIMDVGLNYLALERGAPTLSGGEAQRLRLATQLGASLSQVIYVLDEPTIGLHPNDTAQLVSTLQALKEKPNTVIVVEHDKDMMLAADEIIDVGPGAGIYGGNLVAQGTPEAIAANPDSLTGKYLSGDRSIGILNKSPRKKNGKLTIKGARAFNLKNVDVEIPLGQLVCVTGVSGSGKSTLVVEILAKALAQQLYKTKDLPAEHDAILGLENLNKAITIDQSPIGRSPRSNPATYTGVFSYIRDLFTQMPEAKIKGYDAGDFSFNVKGGGRCENCKGDGYVKVEMQFLPDVYVLCEECKGKRYKKEILEVHYKRKNIADILEMTVQEAKDFFSDIPAIYEKLIVLDEVGLGYISLGQPANTLSGGEAQRIKLATELSRYGTGKTLYILDEPTTGLHFEDINKLLIVLEKLVSKGNSVLVIEHNMEVVKNADWVIDLGPGGGVRGGEVVAAGTPKSVAKVARSLTGKYLNKVL